MVEMPEETIKMFENTECSKEKPVTWIATVTKTKTKGGEIIEDPHITPVCFVKPINKDKLLIGIAFATQTLRNIEKGSKVTVGNAVYANGYMLKGNAKIFTEGELFEDYKERILKRFKGKIQPKAALLVNVEKVYHLKPVEGKKRIA